jgi:hypothetical protein
MNGQSPPKRRSNAGRDTKRTWLVGLVGVVLGAAVLAAAWVAEQHPAPGMALLLPTAAAFFWYRVRLTD